MKQYTVRIPATSANIGPGFDCLGIAFKLFNWFTFSWENSDQPVSYQEQIKWLATRTASQMPMLEAYVQYCRLFNVELPIPTKVECIRNDVPVAKGLGSSATCYVAGAGAAQWIAKQLYSADQIKSDFNINNVDPFSKEAILAIASTIEQHPDNLSPAVFGGLQLAAILDSESLPHVVTQKLNVSSDVNFIISIPNFSLKTAKARGVLPAEVARADAIFNIRALGYLLTGMSDANHDLLRLGLQDRLHQPYRAGLIPNFYEILNIGIKSGACGSVLSGAGPSILTVNINSQVNSQEIKNNIKNCLGNNWEVKVLELDHEGMVGYEGKTTF
ncbi:MAG TPA: homoserine kinase [Clostridiaceae bacterium]|nr:homoserine kinase [Clostridiaceae bacterium]